LRIGARARILIKNINKVNDFNGLIPIYHSVAEEDCDNHNGV